MQHKNLKKILIVGGAGYIGAHLNKLLASKGYQTIIFDNLSSGNRKNVVHGNLIEGDLANTYQLEQVFKKNSIEAVIHFAALIDVGESIIDPAKYYDTNVVCTLNLLAAMRKYAINTFIFSSSAAIFGLPASPILSEEDPCQPINPYGKSKYFIEQILKDFDRAYQLKSCCLRYFNAAGGDPEGEIKNYKQKESNLIPLILRKLKNKDPTPITIYGTDYDTLDGTCIRDYIHVQDLSRAHLLALEKILTDRLSVNFNLGNGKGFSVYQVIYAIEEVTGMKVNYISGKRRAGDPPRLVAAAQSAKKELNWTPQYPDLKVMIHDAWRAFDF